MTWSWQQSDWPRFRYDTSALRDREAAFLRQGGVLIGAAGHLAEGEAELLRVELIAAEALTTSEIEGEVLDRDSLQSSIRRQFGLVTDGRRVRPAEQGHGRAQGHPLLAKPAGHGWSAYRLSLASSAASACSSVSPKAQPLASDTAVGDRRYLASPWTLTRLRAALAERSRSL